MIAQRTSASMGIQRSHFDVALDHDVSIGQCHTSVYAPIIPIESFLVQ